VRQVEKGDVEILRRGSEGSRRVSERGEERRGEERREEQ